jgi:hypothetical protein
LAGLAIVGAAGQLVLFDGKVLERGDKVIFCASRKARVDSRRAGVKYSTTATASSSTVAATPTAVKTTRSTALPSTATVACITTVGASTSTSTAGYFRT